VSRDSQTDDGRMGASAQQKKDMGNAIDFSFMTLQEEKDAGGNTRVTKPEGAEPRPAPTAGTRD
jgi:hypothetical protein